MLDATGRLLVGPGDDEDEAPDPEWDGEDSGVYETTD